MIKMNLEDIFIIENGNYEKKKKIRRKDNKDKKLNKRIFYKMDGVRLRESERAKEWEGITQTVLKSGGWSKASSVWKACVNPPP